MQYDESLLVFSDVHLGSDLNDCTANVRKRSQAIDRDLVQFLQHYRRVKPKGVRWRIVVAGDFIDFIGMSIAPTEELSTEPTEEEREHGVGGAVDHARFKLRRVAHRHADVFAELARFVADGHALTVVHGNHDIEFHWDAVKDDFRAALLSHVADRAGSGPREATDQPALDKQAFLARIEFSPWFFYRDGVAYIEHGHMYDSLCSTELVMSPLSPLDPRRVARGFTEVLLRFVVFPTRGLKEHGHESANTLDYIRFGWRLGVRGLIGLGQRFFSAVFELFRVRRAHLTEAAIRLRKEHDRRVALLAEATRIGVDRLRALLLLQAPPITRSAWGIMRSVLLDRVALTVLSVLSLGVLAVVGLTHGHAFYGAVAVVLAWVLLNRYLVSQRSMDASQHLAGAATKLAKLFPAAFVVMGHTHIPVQAPAGEATYINLGSWAEEDEGATPRAARTHLVIEAGEKRPSATLFTWDSGSGPRLYG